MLPPPQADLLSGAANSAQQDRSGIIHIILLCLELIVGSVCQELKKPVFDRIYQDQDPHYGKYVCSYVA